MLAGMGISERLIGQNHSAEANLFCEAVFRQVGCQHCLKLRAWRSDRKSGRLTGAVAGSRDSDCERDRNKSANSLEGDSDASG
jgi:hypothetical protein